MDNIQRSNTSELLRLNLGRVKHLNITDRLSYDKNAHPFAGGSYGDIRIGTYNDPGRGKLKVAVKCIRLFYAQTHDIMKMIEKEVHVWSSLNHPNILPLLGYILEENDYPTLISEFMEKGTALQYAARNPEFDVTEMILGIAEGVGYLHDRGVIHSDLKSDNILVSREGKPLICDFGISRIVSLSNSFGEYSVCTQSTSDGAKGSARWMSPEILSPSKNYTAKHVKESDVWSFGMTASELLTKRRPYHELRTDPQVMLAIVQGQLPVRPEEYCIWSWNYRTTWELCEACWSRDPAVRPCMSTIVWILRAARTGTIAIINKELAGISRPPCSQCIVLGKLTCICDQMRNSEEACEKKFDRQDLSFPTASTCNGDTTKAVRTLIDSSTQTMERSKSHSETDVSDVGYKHDGSTAAGPMNAGTDDEKSSRVIDSSAPSMTPPDERTRRMNDLDESIKNCRDELALFPPNHRYRSVSLISLAKALRERFKEGGRTEDFEESVEHFRTVLALSPEENSYRMDSLMNLAACMRARFDRGKRSEDLRQVTVYYRAALALCSEDYPDRDRLLHDLAYNLCNLFEITAQLADIEEAIYHYRACLALRPEGHHNRPWSLLNLGHCLTLRFARGRRTEDSEEAMMLFRTTLTFRPENFSGRDLSSNNLGYCLLLRFRQGGQADELEEAITLLRAALDLRPEGHQSRAKSLHNLANCFSARFERFGDEKDRQEADTLLQAAKSSST